MAIESDTRQCSALSVGEWVQQHGGRRCIEKILIANNGISAVKCIRSIRRFSYETFGNDRAIKFVAMATPEDLKVNAEYIKMADSFVGVPSGTNNNNYANVELIVDIAQRTGVQGVWAGWGHASENPKLPEMLKKVGIAFLGPPASAMDSLGDKIASTIVAQSANVPCLPWSGTGVTISVPSKLDPDTILEVPEDVYDLGTVTNPEEGIQAAAKIGYPIMIKASEGGGGKGIRMVTHEKDFAAAFRQVQSEVPGSPIFLMQLAKESRHLEVQLLCDEYNHAIPLYGRDCSVQRRHQKIIEEAPAEIAPADVFVEMERAAVRLAKLVGYESVGTVEYLYQEGNENTPPTFFFLELNPRLQVEHPCTEMITGVNLPSAQLQVAMGVPLHRIKDVRVLYGRDPTGSDEIDFDDLWQRQPSNGHVIAARITAENPDEGFKPTSGKMTELNFRSSPQVWGYFSVGATGGLHEYADSQFGHVFAWGRTREQARKNMAVTLREISVRGDFRTTVEYLTKLVETPSFQYNTINTSWLDSLIRQQVTANKPDIMLCCVATAAHIGLARLRQSHEDFTTGLVRGQILGKEMLGTTVRQELVYDHICYCLRVSLVGPHSLVVELNGSWVDVGVHTLNDGGSLLVFDNASHVLYMKEEVDSYRVTLDGQTLNFRKESDPSIIRCSSPGKLLRYLVDNGEHIDSDQPFAEMEVMKMVLPLVAAHSGRVCHALQAGAVLEAGSVVATLELDDPGKVMRAQPYLGTLPPFSSEPLATKVNQHLSASLEALTNVMDGYVCPEPQFTSRLNGLMETLLKSLADGRLPLLEMQDCLAALSGRIPTSVEAEISSMLTTYAYSVNSMFCAFPCQAIQSVIENHAASLERKDDKDSFLSTVKPISDLNQQYRRGTRGHQKQVLVALIQKYLESVSLFDAELGKHNNFEDAIYSLREKCKVEDVPRLVDMVRSHAHVANKNKLTVLLLDALCGRETAQPQREERELLQTLANLTAKETSAVAVKARQILIQATMPSFKRRCLDMEIFIQSAIENLGCAGGSSLQDLVDESGAVFDVLTAFFDHKNPLLQAAALEVYVRRAYRAYAIQNIAHDQSQHDYRVIEWRFLLPKKHPSVTGLAMFYGKFLSFHTHQPANNSPTPSTDHSNVCVRTGSGLRRVPSVSDQVDTLDQIYRSPDYARVGVMAIFSSLEQFTNHFQELLERFPFLKRDDDGEGENVDWQHGPVNVLNVALNTVVDGRELTDDQMKGVLGAVVEGEAVQLAERDIRRVTFIIVQKESFPKSFTFRDRLSYNEDKIYRHLEPALAFQLELYRMENYDLQYIETGNQNIHLYYALAKQTQTETQARHTDRRFFVRTIIRHQDLICSQASIDYFLSEGERQVIEALNELEVVNEDARYAGTDDNVIFLNFVSTVTFELGPLLDAMHKLILRHGKRFWRNRVLQAEIKTVCRFAESQEDIVLRVYVQNESGYSLHFHCYREEYDSGQNRVLLKSVYPIGQQGPLHDMDASVPYSFRGPLLVKRYQAQSIATTYVSDFPELFAQALKLRWLDASHSGHVSKQKLPQNFVDVIHLNLDEENHLVAVKELPANYNIGIMASRLTLYTPEYPSGRDVILISNDITHVIGSFGVQEDRLYQQASLLARQEGIPRIYISCNSGARIGLATEVMKAFKVAWSVPGEPTKGFRYLYLSEKDAVRLVEAGSVCCEEIFDEGEKRFKIVDIIGAEDGLGVENLHGSGLIAGETSQAYTETVTLNLVTCRSVGIGAYLVRLGQRVVQVEGSSIILTGAGALNKVLGSKVYSSNQQLGGTHIMYHNGVAHMTVPDDFAGVSALVQWLGYLPQRRNAPLPVLSPVDPVDRLVEFMPSKQPYDPRHMIGGRLRDDGSNQWESGLFDRNSFTECLGGWAKTVVTGRARLGGIPVGVIAVETRTVQKMQPADPANQDTEAKVVQQAGMVWYPDSAYKTAQVLWDFDNEELPIVILANWRGFSGGMRDMYDEVLKYGAYIVDALKKCTQPVLIYIPPNGELRGGAWVVVDPAINDAVMELYADREARGGVLEAEGTVQIKFRKDQQIRLMARTDPTYMSLVEAKKVAQQAMEENEEQGGAEPMSSEHDIKAIERQMRAREKELLPIYHQVAVHFADLHDGPTRMLKKDCISDILDWPTSRKYLYWRLRVRILTNRLAKDVVAANPTLSYKQGKVMVDQWLVDSPISQSLHDNKIVTEWLEANSTKLANQVEAVRQAYQLRVAKDVGHDSAVAMETVIGLAKDMTLEQRQQLVGQLQAL